MDTHKQAMEIDHPKFKEYGNLQAIRNDLFRAIMRFERILAIVDEVEKATQFEAALIAYRRCFTKGVRSTIAISDGLILDKGAEDLSRHLRDMADKFVAHSVNPFEKIACGAAFLDNGTAVVASLNVRLVSYKSQDISQFVKHVQEIIDCVVDPKIEVVAREVQEIADAMSESEISELSPMSISGMSREDAGKSRRK